MADETGDPFAEGRDARLAGKSETTNPYNLDTDALTHMSWNDGYASVDDTDEDEEIENV